MTSLHFMSVIEIHNGNPFVLVDKDQAQVLKKGWKRPMPVLVQIWHGLGLKVPDQYSQ